MKIKTITGAIALLCMTTAFSAEENIQLGKIVTTATRTPQPREAVIADVSVIEADEIQRGGQTTLVELLQLQPGIEITSNGGAGQTSGIFMRGTNSGHVVVLIDGMRITSATAGTATFENLPLELIDRIEILRGPASSLYGQDAIGGVIQIFTKKGDGHARPYASLGFGTYNTRIGEAGIRGQANDTRYAINFTASDREGFSALDSHDVNIRDDDAYRNFGISANVSQRLAEGHEMGMQLLNSEGTAHFDTSSNLSNYSSKNRMQQLSVSLTSKNQWTSAWLSTLRVGMSKDKQRIYDELSFFNPIQPALYQTEQIQINWQNDLKLPVGTLTLMYDRLEEDIKSTTIYDETNRVNEGYIASYLGNIGAHSLNLSLRDDHNSRYGQNLTGGIGYGYSFNSNWRITTSYGSAIKAPTFNDLYWPGFSNPKLQPEKSDNIEISLRYQDNSGSFTATLYDNHIRNLIAFDTTTYTIENLNKARIKGLTLASTQQWMNFSLSGSIDIQSPKDKDSDNLLPRRANHTGKLFASYDWHDWRFGAELLASSNRYNDKANNKRLAGYGLVNFTAAYAINQDWSIQARANNVLDKRYALSYDFSDIPYNTPGANVFINIRYQPE